MTISMSMLNAQTFELKDTQIDTCKVAYKCNVFMMLLYKYIQWKLVHLIFNRFLYNISKDDHLSKGLVDL